MKRLRIALMRFWAAHMVAVTAVVALLVVGGACVSALTVAGVQRSLGVAEPTPAVVPKSPVVIGQETAILNAAAERATPTATAPGTCSQLGTDDQGNYYVQVRTLTGVKCLTYNFSQLQDITKPDGTTAKTGTFTDSGTGVTTTIVQNPDGSGSVTTTGEYYKLYLDRASTMYIMVNGTEMSQRFLYCMTTSYTNAAGQPDVRLLTPAEQQQRWAAPYPYAAPDCNAGNLPTVQYQ